MDDGSVMNFNAINLYSGWSKETSVSKGEKYSFSNDTGTGNVTVYHVFPGIDLLYNEIHMAYCSNGARISGNVIEINHCQQGRSECGFGNRSFGYMGPGDLAFCSLGRVNHSTSFPLNHYHGITITVDYNAIDENTKSLLRSFAVNLDEVLALLSEKDFMIVRANPYIEHVFSELYAVDDSMRDGYLRVKVIELLLTLTNLKSIKEKRRYLSRAQTELAKSVQEKVAEHPSAKMTIDSLAADHGVSPTHLKNCFREVYGTSVYAYIKDYRLQLAAKFLCETDLSVHEIAGMVGFENPNKFSSAFRTHFGMTPTEYKKSVRMDRNV